mgnify:CR=1 FL=1
MPRNELLDHLAQGITTLCRAWLVTRRDGVRFGFTDHDRDLAFGGYNFRASTGMTARALQQTTGLSVDNTEAIGALSDAALREEDIAAGRFDGAEVRSWLVNWADPSQRIEQFRGSFGEVTRGAGAFRVELRGLSDVLNQTQGRAFQRGCSAVLGDAACGFDLAQPGYSVNGQIADIDDLGRIFITAEAPQASGWFSSGRLKMVGGRAEGLVGMVKTDDPVSGGRLLALWHDFAVPPAVGDLVALTAGCDKSANICRNKFSNFMNFRGFPHIPGDDWLTSYPVASQPADGRGWSR